MGSERVSSDSIERTLLALSRQLKALRSERGFRLADLAHLTGFSEAYLYRIEEGERSPSLPALIRVAEVYGIPVTKLFEHDQKEQRSAHHSGSAIWRGTERDGSGTMFSSSVTPSTYNVASRLGYGSESATSPEEHIGMAIAGCFSMSLAQKLEVAGFKPESIETTADVILRFIDDRLEINRILMHADVVVAEIDDTRLNEIAQDTRRTCVVARAMAAVPVRLELSRNRVQQQHEPSIGQQSNPGDDQRSPLSSSAHSIPRDSQAGSAISSSRK
ncbi:MAG: OsmC family peroxiredoxin [Candidatus Leucobacter sulfamidivorax]|nr:OsmC family peroxiredoxin [Candidatus Leucobacter sulfamidivorax]